MGDGNNAVTSRKVIEEALLYALQRSTAPKDDVHWWDPTWDPRELWGTGSPAVEDGPGRDAVAQETRAAIAHLDVEVDDEQAFRLYCGALMESLRDSADETDTDSPRRPLQAAYVLLGLAPLSFYEALADQDGAKTWLPLGMSRKDILADLTRKREKALVRRGTPSTSSPGPVNWFGSTFDARQVNTRRVLVSYLLTGGALTYDNWKTGRRAQLSALPPQIHQGVLRWLKDPPRLAALTARLTAVSEVPAAHVDSFVPVVAVGPDPTDGVAYRTRREARGAGFVRRVLGPPVVSAVAAVVAVTAAVGTYVALDSSDADAIGAEGGSVSASPDGDGSTGTSGEVAPEPTTPLLGAVEARNLSYTSGPDGAEYDDWLSQVVLGNKIGIRIKLRNPSEETVGGVGVQLQSDAVGDRYMTSDIAETLEVRLRTDETAGYVVPLDETPVTVEDDVTTYDAASTIFSAPDNDRDHCSTSGRFVPNGLTYKSRSSLDPNLYYTSEVEEIPDSSGDDKNRPVGRYFVGDIEPGETVTLNVEGTFRHPDPDTAMMSGGNAVEVGVEDHDWTRLDSARVGDTVTALVQVHDSSCSITESAHVVKLRQSTSRAGVITLTGTVDRDIDLGSSKISLTGTKRGRLEPVAGTTRLSGIVITGTLGEDARCAKIPTALKRLPDGIMQAGVEVSVVGYLPREPCHSHLRWVMTDFRVVGK